jgi:hypothetical protein
MFSHHIIRTTREPVPVRHPSRRPGTSHPPFCTTMDSDLRPDVPYRVCDIAAVPAWLFSRPPVHVVCFWPGEVCRGRKSHVMTWRGSAISYCWFPHMKGIEQHGRRRQVIFTQIWSGCDMCPYPFLILLFPSALPAPMCTTFGLCAENTVVLTSLPYLSDELRFYRLVEQERRSYHALMAEVWAGRPSRTCGVESAECKYISYDGRTAIAEVRCKCGQTHVGASGEHVGPIKVVRWGRSVGVTKADGNYFLARQARR